MLMSRRLAQAFVLKMCRVLKNDQVPKPYVHEKNDCQRVACFVYAPGMATKIMVKRTPRMFHTAWGRICFKLCPARSRSALAQHE